MPTEIDIADLPTRVGEHLGYSDWQTVTQEQVDRFADATGDYQWIHNDPVRAAKGPFGGPIAAGYLTMSLIEAVLGKVLVVHGISMALNYGANRIRFPAPVPVGAEVRMGATLAGAEETGGGIQVTLDTELEVRDADKPSCVAQVVYRFYK